MMMMMMLIIIMLMIMMLLFSQSITKKTNDPKVFKLGTVNDLGIF